MEKEIRGNRNANVMMLVWYEYSCNRIQTEVLLKKINGQLRRCNSSLPVLEMQRGCPAPSRLLSRVFV